MITLHHSGLPVYRYPQTVTRILLESSCLRPFAGVSSPLQSSHPTSPADPSVEGLSHTVSPSTASPAEGDLDMDYRGSSIPSGVAGVVPTAGDSGHEQVGVVEGLRKSSPVVAALLLVLETLLKCV